MADILKPELSSKKNIQEFINSIEDERLRKLISDHLGDLLIAGMPEDKRAEEARHHFQEAVKKLIEAEVGEAEHEN
jgi:hypothetical protein